MADTYVIVEAYTASWIEITYSAILMMGTVVEAYTVSWIEIEYLSEPV